MSLSQRNEVLKKKVKGFKKEKDDLERENVALKRKNEDLIIDYSNLVSTLGGVTELVEETLRLSKDLKTPREVIEGRAEENKNANTTLNDWLRGPKKILEDRLALYERQSQIFEGLAFSEVTSIFINRDAVARKNSVAFYDFPNTRFYYNNKAARLLEMKFGEVYTSLHQLLGKIRNNRVILKKENAQKSILKRKYLFQILKQGKELTGFEIQVQAEEGKFKKLYLTTRLVNYVSRKGDIRHKKAFGILMLFDEHKRVSKEYVEAEQILRELDKKFKSIYETFEQ